MINTILTDLDGVIRIWPLENDQQAEQATGLPPGAIRRMAFSKDRLIPAVTGRIRDDQWRQQVVEALRQDFPQADAERAVTLWSASIGQVNTEVLTLLQACRSKARIILISNATSRLPTDLQKLGIADAFDHIINSSEAGIVKPDPAIYRLALRTSETSAENTFFVDDKAENVAAACQLGIKGHVYTSTDALQQELNRLGVI